MHPVDAQYRAFPGFSTWMGNRVPNDLWERSVRLLLDRRTLAQEATFAMLADRAARVASIDTGAIEGLYSVDRGFTLTVASMASGWEAEIQQEKGPGVAALVAAQRAGYDLALDAATSRTEITEAWIRRLHEVVCEPQDTYDVRTAAGPQRHKLPRGEYKHAPNHVELPDGSVHAYAPVEETPSEMHRLVTEFRSAAFASAHPVLQASYAHYALVCIHPFADGNGRVARTLASIFTFRNVSLPFVIFADQKDAYLTALEQADEGRFQAFVDFVLFRAVDLQQLISEQLLEAQGASIDEAASLLRGIAELPQLPRLREQVRAEVVNQLDGQHLPETVRWDVETIAGSELVRLPKSFPILRLWISTFSPKRATVEEHIAVIGYKPSDEADPLYYVVRRQRRDDLNIRHDEITPAPSATLQLRIEAWVRRVIAELLTKLAEEAQVP